MKKSTIVVALLFTITVPTLTSYAGGPFYRTKENIKEIYVDPNSMPGGKDNPWVGSGGEYMFTYYPGRIVGTWQKRGEDFYYILPDGTDLKNAYVDGLYLSWTGRMIREVNTVQNWLMYNACYAGQEPMNAAILLGISGSRNPHLMSWQNSDKALADYKSGVVSDINYAKETFDWIDSQMPNVINLPEQERAKAIARLVAGKLQRADNYLLPAEAFHTGSGTSKTFASIYSTFAERAGLTVSIEDGKSPYSDTAWWNTVRINGQNYYTDSTAYKLTGAEIYTLSPTLWSSYTSRDALVNAEIESANKAQEEINKYRQEHPELQGGSPTSGLTGGAV